MSGYRHYLSWTPWSLEVVRDLVSWNGFGEASVGGFWRSSTYKGCVASTDGVIGGDS